ncbi:hypothetical protein NL676_019378 [Syzygium grande]|nr:hypothetical protein NL676_019378 [Syzygium grande]
MLRVNFGGEVGDITSFTIYNKRDFLKRNLGPGDLNSSYYFLLQNQENNQKKRESKTVLLKQIAVGKKESKTVLLSLLLKQIAVTQSLATPRPILTRSLQALSLSFAVVPPFPGSIVREFEVLLPFSWRTLVLHGVLMAAFINSIGGGKHGAELKLWITNQSLKNRYE